MNLFRRKSISNSLTVSNNHGIHIRPSINISLLVKEYPETVVIFSFNGRRAHGTNINEILALAAGYGDKLELYISGPKSKRLFKTLKKLFADFDQYDGPSQDMDCFNSKKIESGCGRLMDDRMWD